MPMDDLTKNAIERKTRKLNELRSIREWLVATDGLMADPRWKLVAKRFEAFDRQENRKLSVIGLASNDGHNPLQRLGYAQGRVSMLREMFALLIGATSENDGLMDEIVELQKDLQELQSGVRSASLESETAADEFLSTHTDDYLPRG